MSERLLLDTGPLVAWLDREDQWHDSTVALSKELRPPFLTSGPVLTEACFLLRRLPRAIAQIRAWVEGGHIQIPFCLKEESRQVFALMEKHRNLPMSLADACLVIMVECGIGDRVFTLDQHFRICRQSSRRLVPVLIPE